MTESEELRGMIAEYARGDISEERLRRLETALRQDDGFRNQFIEYMNVDAALGDLAALSESELSQLDGLPAETNDSMESSVTANVAMSKFNRVSWRLVAALAACLLVAVGLWWQFGTGQNEKGNFAIPGDGGGQLAQGNNADSANGFATIVQLSEVQWLDGKQLMVGDRVSARSLQLEEGVVHLRFDSGVGVTLEGPADFEVTSAEETRLRFGLLTATVPPGAEGFRVDTPTARVVDLGTAFGIDQRPDGISTVSVFDGEVEIISVDDSDKRLLTEGKSVQLAVDGSVSEVEFASQPFEKLWPIASGIAGSTGAFRFAPPWPRRLSLIQSDTEIIVLPEGYAIHLEEPCPVDIEKSELIESSIPEGQRVRSFLLQFNPVDPEEKKGKTELGNKMRRIEGSITFDRPVIGMIVNSETLKVTDEIFSLHRGPIRPFARGLELNPSRTADVVSLSEDRQTLTLKLAVFNQFSDHVRVIVDASHGDDEESAVNSN